MIDRLHYISQAAYGGHLEAIERVLLAGGKWVQLRIKNEPDSVVLRLAIAAAALCKKHGARLIVNDDPLIALKAAADGVHLGLNDMPVAAARAILGPGKLIGGTANTFADIRLRVAEGVDYIGLGPYRFTTTKANLSPVIGLSGYITLMEQVKKAGIGTPLIAIGGITAADIPLLMQAGLYGVAMSGAMSIPNPAVYQLKNGTC